MSATRLGVLRCPAVREAGEEQTEGSRLLFMGSWGDGQFAIGVLSGEDTLMGGRSASMSPGLLREETCELPLSRHRGSAREQGQGGTAVQRHAERLRAETLRNHGKDSLQVAGVCQKLFA